MRSIAETLIYGSAFEIHHSPRLAAVPECNKARIANDGPKAFVIAGSVMFRVTFTVRQVDDARLPEKWLETKEREVKKVA